MIDLRGGLLTSDGLSLEREKSFSPSLSSESGINLMMEARTLATGLTCKSSMKLQTFKTGRAAKLKTRRSLVSISKL